MPFQFSGTDFDEAFEMLFVDVPSYWIFKSLLENKTFINLVEKLSQVGVIVMVDIFLFQVHGFQGRTDSKNGIFICFYFGFNSMKMEIIFNVLCHFLRVFFNMSGNLRGNAPGDFINGVD